MLVFLVHNDEPQRLHRRKDGRASADDNLRAALSNLVPFVVAFACGKMTVQHRHQSLQRPAAKSRLKALHRLRSQ